LEGHAGKNQAAHQPGLNVNTMIASQLESDPKASPAVIYQWNAWNNFLLPRLLPNSIRIDANVTDRATAVMRQVPETTRLFAFHVDCTNTARFPLERDQLIHRLRDMGARVINASMTDISKRRVQQMCASLGLPTVTTTAAGPADELLMIKTDLNSAGLPESRLGYLNRWRLGVRSPKVITGRGDYRVLPRSEIPAHWWTDETLVIQKYIANRRDAWYRVYAWFDRIAVFEGICRTLVRRMHRAEQKRSGHYIEDPIAGATFVGGDDCAPGTLLDYVFRFRSSHELAFCSLDVMEDNNGDLYIVDLNVTPFCRDSNAGYVQFLQNGVPPT
jgi:hypothetical protein